MHKLESGWLRAALVRYCGVGSRAWLGLRRCCQVDRAAARSSGKQPFIPHIRGAYFFLRGGIWLVGALSALYCTCKNKQEFGRRQVIRAQRSAR